MIYLLEGLRLISRPGLRHFVVMPILINIIVFTGLFFFLYHYISHFNDWFMGQLPAWLHFLSLVIWVLFFISFFIIFIYAFIAIANLIASPFNAFLAEQVEFLLTGIALEPRGWMDNIKDIPRLLARQFRIMGYYLPRALFLFLLFFVPILHFLTPLLWLILNAWYLCLLYLDYPTDNHRVPLEEVREWMNQRRITCFLFGVSILAASFVPIFNFFVIPAAAAGATKFWLDERKEIKHAKR